MAETEEMTYEQASDEIYYWAEQQVEDRERAFDALLGWVAGRAITGDPGAASTLRLIHDKAERQ